MKLAIADPPYPPSRGGTPRASRWYGAGAATLGPGAYAADFHAEAHEWDQPERHRELLDHLMSTYDGWAIATASDGIDAYHPLPCDVRTMVWVKPNAMPSAARIHNRHELVLLRPPLGRRGSRNGAGVVSDVLVAPKRNGAFAGAKPPEWTRWVLDAMSYRPAEDEVHDLFPGSGSVAAALGQGALL